MHIISGGDSKHLKKGRDQICFKREGTLALTCSLMYLYGSSMLSILITDSFLTSTPDPTGKKQIPERKDNIQHGIDAMRIQE